MACTHERLKCTDNVYYCALCGVKITFEEKGDITRADEKDANKGQIKASKRKSKKDGEKHD